MLQVKTLSIWVSKLGGKKGKLYRIGRRRWPFINVLCKQAKKEEMQFLNSGYNNHMSGINEWFPDLDESFRQSTKLNNDTRRTILEKGSVRMQMNGVGHVIYDV